MKFCTALLTLAGLTGCAHFSAGQSVGVDAKNHLVARLEGASLRASMVPAKAPGEPIHRVIQSLDGNKVLFAYDLETGKGTADGSHIFRLKPSKQKPTFASVREVTVNSKQESVRVELMENSATGEKVADILQLQPNETQQEMMSPMEHLKKVHNMLFNYLHGH